MATSITWPPIGGSSFSIPAAGEVGWPSLSNFLIALQNAQSTESQKIAIRTATTTPISVASATDCVVRVELSVAGPSSVVLPAGVNGQYFVIVDGLGDASTNNITITANGAETINGQASLVIDQDYGAYALCFRSGNWTVVGAFGAAGGAGSVPRSDIAPGQPDYVVINNNLGELSEEQYLSQSRGGMGTNVSGFTGVVKAAAGAFSASTIVNADISASAAIDATKIADGSVTSTEFQYLGGVTSDIQTQINNITGAGITSLTGDVTATGPGAAAATIANGAVTDAKVASGIDAAKLANGTVSNTEYQYLGGVTSDIQTQLDGKQPLDADLTAIAGLSSTGLIARTGAGTASTRTITGTTNLITVTDGDGVSGNPTINVGSSVVTLTGTQALTNKDYDGGTASNTSRLTIPKDTYANLVALTRKEGTLVYATDQDTVYADDGTNLIPVGSGSSGTGTLNIVDNPSAVSSTTGWTAATNYTVTRDTSNSPLAGVIDTCFAISTTTASSETNATQGVYAGSLAMPVALRNTKTQVSLYLTTPATADGVWRVSIWNASGTRMSLSSDSSGATTLPGGYNGQFVCTFDADSSATYSITFVQTTRTNANTLYVTNISIGNGITAQGAAISEWQSYTPTLTNGGSTSTNTGRWRRVGSTMEIQTLAIFTGAGSASAFSISIPSGYTIDTSAEAGGQQAGALPQGTAQYYNGSTFSIYQTAYITTTSPHGIVFINQGGSTFLLGNALASTHQFGMKVSVPIAEWAGSGTVNLGQGAQVEYAYNSSGITSAGATDTTAFAYGPAGATIGSIASTTGSNSVTTMRVRFQYPIQTDDLLVLETDGNTSGARWFEFGQYLGSILLQGTSIYGAYLRQVNATDVDVVFGNRGYLSTGATYGDNGSPWSGVSTFRWRVRKSTASAPVGFGLADSNGQAGIVNPYTEGSGVVYSGRFTPTLTNGANIASSSASSCMYSRIGKIVTVSGVVTCATTAAANTLSVISMSLPIASNLASTLDARGSGSREAASGTAYAAVSIEGDATNDRATLTFASTSTSSLNISFSFQYEIK